MAWSVSAMFGAFLLDPMAKASGKTAVGYGSLTADTINVALFNNTGTPDKNAAVGSTGYNTGQWVTANEVTDATNWVAGGRTLAGNAFSSVTNGVEFTGTNLSGGGTVTLSNAFGCLVYDNTITSGTVAKQGVCFNYFGGSQSVTAGTFTIVWNASGIFQITA